MSMMLESPYACLFEKQGLHSSQKGFAIKGYIVKKFLCVYFIEFNNLRCFLYLCISAGNWHLESFYTRKKSRLQTGEPGASVSWDDSYFCLHENFRFGVQEWIRHVVLFWDPWFPIQGSRAENHWVAPSSTQPFILPRSIKWVPGLSGNWMVKSKLPPRSGCSLEAVESHPWKKGP